MKKLLIALCLMFSPITLFAAGLTLPQGGLGTTTVPKDYVLVGKDTLRITAVATSTLGVWLSDILRGLVAGNMILVTNNTNGVVASSTPTAAAYLATSTAATSTFQGTVLALNGGNVGIATSTPQAQLVISVATTTGEAFRVISDVAGSVSPNIFTIKQNGRIGIGTISPVAQFQMDRNNNDGFGASMAFNKTRLGGAVNLADILGTYQFRGETGSGSLVAADIIAGMDAAGTISGSSFPGSMTFRTTPNGSITPTAGLTITSSQFVGMGTTTPAWLLSVQSAADTNILALKDSDGLCLHNPESSSETVTCSSDQSLKKNITDYATALGWINGYRIRRFTVKASGETEIGVIAQELQKTHPDSVTIDKRSNTLMVELPSIWILVGAIQEQQQEIQDLQNRLKALDGKNPAPIQSRIPWTEIASGAALLASGGALLKKKK